jgi:hypothetical protein
MKRKIKFGCALVIVVTVIIAIIFGLHWAWKYYLLPEWVDCKEYKTIEERAERAIVFIKQNSMNENYMLFVDYSIPSGTPRLFVWDFQRKKIVASTYVMHGPGKGSTDKRPVFSNEPGSECSALGRFLVTKEHGATLKRSFRLKGMDGDNKTAYSRVLMIHGSTFLDGHVWMRYIPLHRASCQGCVTVTSRGMDYIWELVNNEKVPLLLWSYYEE